MSRVGDSHGGGPDSMGRPDRGQRASLCKPGLSVLGNQCLRFTVVLPNGRGHPMEVTLNNCVLDAGDSGGEHHSSVTQFSKQLAGLSALTAVGDVLHVYCPLTPAKGKPCRAKAPSSGPCTVPGTGVGGCHLRLGGAWVRIQRLLREAEVTR